MKLRKQGTGLLKLVDGKRVKLAVPKDSAAALARFKFGQVCLIAPARRPDFVAHSWPKRRSGDWLNHAAPG